MPTMIDYDTRHVSVPYSLPQVPAEGGRENARVKHAFLVPERAP